MFGRRHPVQKLVAFMSAICEHFLGFAVGCGRARDELPTKKRKSVEYHPQMVTFEANKKAPYVPLAAYVSDKPVFSSSKTF